MRTIGRLPTLLGGVLVAATIALPASASSLAEVTVEFHGDSVAVTSSKDLSNVVLGFCDGSTERFEDLTAPDGTFAGSDGQVITTVWVKSGSFKSGDGPGYGERFDAAEGVCDAPPTDGDLPGDDFPGDDLPPGGILL